MALYDIPQLRLPARRSVTLRLRGIPISVSRARDRIVEFARAAGYSDEQLFDIGLAVGEACSNAVMHSTSHDSWFRVEASAGPDRLTVKVSDPGQATVPPLERDADRVGGIGLFLMRRLMDKISLDMSPSGTKLTMSCRRIAA